MLKVDIWLEEGLIIHNNKYVLKSNFYKKNDVDTHFQMLSCQDQSHWLVDLAGEPIRGLVFGKKVLKKYGQLHFWKKFELR